MRKVLKSLFDKWWPSILFWFLALTLVLIIEIYNAESILFFGYTFLFLALVKLTASSIYQLLKRRWITGILSGILVAGTIGGFLLAGLVIFVKETIDGDRWADNLTIPANIQLDTPIDLTTDLRRPDSMLSVIKTTIDLQLYNSFQPGLYEYDFWISKLERGTIYLKAFEITQEYALSANRLPESSAVTVHFATDTMIRLETTHDFTIYEGDWGKLYAARFEVWFKPGNGGKERKLFQKNFRIEGWQR